MSESLDRVHIQTPAKLNLGLRVLGKRPDGYHEIETLFVAVTLFDELIIERRRQGGLAFNVEPGGPDIALHDLSAGEDNLVVRAVRRFEQDSGQNVNAAICLRKSIPVAAGLGGGSSDAAATLVGLNMLYPHASGQRDLHKLACDLGADVPFFLGPPAAFGRGRGELLSPARIDVRWYAILACPNVASQTREVYAALDLTSRPQMSHFPARLEGDGFFAALALIHNDLQDVVERRVPQVLHWKNQLLTLGAEGAYVSGSGPTVFGVFRSKPDPIILDRIRASGVSAYTVRPLDTAMTMVIGSS